MSGRYQSGPLAPRPPDRATPSPCWGLTVVGGRSRTHPSPRLPVIRSSNRGSATSAGLPQTVGSMWAHLDVAVGPMWAHIGPTRSESTPVLSRTTSTRARGRAELRPNRVETATGTPAASKQQREHEPRGTAFAAESAVDEKGLQRAEQAGGAARAWRELDEVVGGGLAGALAGELFGGD